VVDAEGDVTCGCGATCEHVPVLEEVVLPPMRPRVAMARRRGLSTRDILLDR
jgi:hypothetical protein